VKWARLWYWLFVIGVVALLIVATLPILASDLFRQPYHPLWATINDLMARFRYTYNPSGGGQPPRYPRWRDPADAGIYFREVQLQTADGLELTAWYVPASQPGSPSVLLAHGLLDSKWTMLRLVPWLHDAGYNVMLLDFRGHGGSDKRPTTVGRDEVFDIKAALDWLDAEGAGEWVAGLGMSLGAASLVNTAIQDDRLDALILDSMFADWSDVDYAEEYNLAPDWIVPGVPSPVKLLPNLRLPVFIIHGTADILTHVDHAYRLYNAANEPKELWINDSGHAWSAWTYPDRFQDKVLTFLDNVRSTP
jgi:alpha-beta hydrolase superfamily lysophospholipase